ncbi:hypothetical protein KEM56_006500, partial [Ascosphaera pollenicola]
MKSFAAFALFAAVGSVIGLPINSSNAESYHSNAICTADYLLQLFDSATGLWHGDFWQSANILSAVADIFELDSSYHAAHGNSIFSTAYENAPKSSGYAGFHNKFNDDVGWWAVAFLNVYDLTNDQTYLKKAQDLVDYMGQSSGTPCGGGIWWTTDRSYVAAISNELYIQAAAGLANRLESSSDKEKYFKIADQTFDWFFKSGIVSKDWAVSDGLQQVSGVANNTNGTVANGTASCQPTGATFT